MSHEARRRAREGQARRRKMKAPMRRQVAAGATQLVATFLLGVAALSSYVADTGGQWASRRWGSSRADIVEIFGGHSEVSLRASQRGLFALQPYDRRYGCDLLDPAQRAALLDDLARLRPRLAISWNSPARFGAA